MARRGLYDAILTKRGLFDAALYKQGLFDDNFVAVSVSCALTGTITASATQADIRAGGKTIILTLTGDTWVAAGATFDAQRQNIINGIDSAQSEALGWDNIVKGFQGVAGVVRTSNTVVTITLDAQITYTITANETITATIPGSALTLGGAVVGAPTFTVAAGSVFAADRSESIAFTDSQTSQLEAAAARAESLAFTDSQSATAVFAADRSESVTFTDSVSATAVLAASEAESIALTDTQTTTLIMSANVAESMAFADSQDASVVSGTTSQTDESLAFTESQAATAVFAATRDESLAFADGVSATGVFNASIFDSIAFTDTQTGTVPTPGVDNVDESIGFSASQSASMIYVVGVQEGISFADSYIGTISELSPTQRNLTLSRPLARDRLRDIFGDHRAIKAFEQLDRDFGGINVKDGDGKIFGDVQRYGQDGASAAVGNDNRFRRAAYNASLQPQSVPAATRTYVDGSDITFQDGLKAGTQLTWRFNVTKTAAGTAASTFDIAFGDTATTIDAARVSFTKPGGTAVADEGLVEIFCTIESVGAGGVAVGTFKLSHDSTTGHATTPLVVRTTTSAAFSTSGVTKAGICITSGAADAITISHCQAKGGGMT